MGEHGLAPIRKHALVFAINVIHVRLILLVLESFVQASTLSLIVSYFRFNISFA